MKIIKTNLFGFRGGMVPPNSPMIGLKIQGERGPVIQEVLSEVEQESEEIVADNDTQQPPQSDDAEIV